MLDYKEFKAELNRDYDESLIRELWKTCNTWFWNGVQYQVAGHIKLLEEATIGKRLRRYIFFVAEGMYCPRHLFWTYLIDRQPSKAWRVLFPPKREPDFDEAAEEQAQ